MTALKAMARFMSWLQAMPADEAEHLCRMLLPVVRSRVPAHPAKRAAGLKGAAARYGFCHSSSYSSCHSSAIAAAIANDSSDQINSTVCEAEKPEIRSQEGRGEGGLGDSGIPISDLSDSGFSLSLSESSSKRKGRKKPAGGEKPGLKASGSGKKRPPVPGLLRLMELQRSLGGEALEDANTAITYNRVTYLGQDVLEAAIRKAWAADAGNTAIRSLRWLLANVDRYIAKGPAGVPTPRRNDRRAEEDAFFEERIREAEEREREAEEPIQATEVEVCR